jgi:hypothetical protein
VKLLLIAVTLYITINSDKYEMASFSTPMDCATAGTITMMLYRQLITDKVIGFTCEEEQ